MSLREIKQQEAVEAAFHDFESRFENLWDYYRFLEVARWPTGFKCPSCSGKGWMLKRKRETDIPLYECSKCNKQTSLFSGTALHRSHVHVEDLLWVAHLMLSLRDGITAKELSSLSIPRGGKTPRPVVNLGYQAVYDLFGRFRRAMARGRVKRLEGTIEVAQVQIPVNGGRSQTVIGCLEIKKIKRRNGGQRDKLGRLILLQQDLLPKSCTSLNEIALAVGPGAKKRVSSAHLNRVFSSLTAWMASFNGVSQPKLQLYLDEFCYKFNLRYSRLRSGPRQEYRFRFLRALAEDLMNTNT